MKAHSAGNRFCEVMLDWRFCCCGKSVCFYLKSFSFLCVCEGKTQILEAGIKVKWEYDICDQCFEKMAGNVDCCFVWMYAV